MSISYMQLKFSKQKRDRKGAWVICKTCNKEFYVVPSRVKKGMVKYCSMKCYPKKGDDNPFWGKKHSPETIDKMVKHPNRYFFKADDTNPNVRFSDNDYWGGSYYWWQQHRSRRTEVCERCGFDRTEILNVHHKDRSRKNNSPENIEILCPNCHMLEHYSKKDGPFHNKHF